MYTKTGIIEEITSTSLADIPGLTFRGFQGQSDFPKILKIIHGCNEIDELKRADTLVDISNTFAHLHHCDPYQYMLFSEMSGETVAYSRVWWAVDGSGQWIGFQNAKVLPEWRHKGIGSRLLEFNEGRLCQISEMLKINDQLRMDAVCVYDTFADDSEIDRKYLLEHRGYQPVRYAYEMVRPNLENVPELPLPPGVEVRRVEPEHLRLIWEASNEAFRDHWGYIPDPWEEFERLLDDPDIDPSLWRVAWEGDQVAGMVMSYIDKDQNERFGWKRGYTENIFVRRPWRRKGLAKALIAISLSALKERGMTEAALGVDAENISGALHIYESMGNMVTKSSTIYRKPIKGLCMTPSTT